MSNYYTFLNDNEKFSPTHGVGWQFFLWSVNLTKVCLSYRKMRNYIRKTNRGNVSRDKIDRAVKMVLEEKKTLTSVGTLFNIPRSTLARYVKKTKEPTTNHSR